MRYNETIAELEGRGSLDGWKEVPSSEMLEDRLVAMRQLQAFDGHLERGKPTAEIEKAITVLNTLGLDLIVSDRERGAQ
ncbi:MAG: hypothetical protein LBL86_09890 [Coriobacteriales bacterium]|jgi:hypothetical protein|nr:hypothetical protein [Coriobacteriales bacterium]